MPTALEMKPKEWRKFKNLNQIIAVREQSRLVVERRIKALNVAQKAASILRKQFHAKKVVMFGSITCPEIFTIWSDIDLAVWGIEPDDFFSAVASVTGLTSEFKIDLVDPETCREPIKDSIQKFGVEIKD